MWHSTYSKYNNIKQWQLINDNQDTSVMLMLVTFCCVYLWAGAVLGIFILA